MRNFIKLCRGTLLGLVLAVSIFGLVVTPVQEARASLYSQFIGSPPVTNWLQFSIPGTYTYVAPFTGLYLLDVCGSGAGGGAGKINSGGGGGGGGGEGRGGLVQLTAGSSYTITIPSGGLGGTTTGGLGTSGSAASFGSFITANGGVASAVFQTGGLGGSGGTSTNVLNGWHNNGGAGGTSPVGTTTSAGSGGGGAGTILGVGGVGGNSSVNGTTGSAAGGGGAPGNGAGGNGVSSTQGGDGGFPLFAATSTGTSKSLMGLANTLSSGPTNGTTTPAIIIASVALGQMQIGTSDIYFSGGASSGSPTAGGLYGGAGGPFATGGSSQPGAAGGAFSGGSGTADGPSSTQTGQVGGQGGLCGGGGAGGNETNATFFKNGGPGGAGYVAVGQIQHP